MTESVLLIDDDEALLKSVGALLERIGYSVAGEMTGVRGIEAYEQTGPDVVVLDLRLPDMSGLDVLKQLKTRGASVILLTGHGDVPTAVEALRLGAEDFLTKPVDLPHLSAALSRTVGAARMRKEIDRLKSELHRDVTLASLGVSDQMQDIGKQIARLAQVDRSTILLTGESGTGKGWVARLIHRLSPRADGPFLSVICGGLSANADQDELFGGEGSTSGGRRQDRRGLYRMAHDGVLFLDEVGDLPLDLQGRLSGVLETRSLVAGDRGRSREPDVSIIGATNQDLDELVASGRFRKDLRYRIGVAVIPLPPLRRRSREDCVDLVRRLMFDLTSELPHAPAEIHPDALQRLVEHPWPGNVRELRNVLEWAMIMARGSSVVLREHLPQELRGAGAVRSNRSRRQTLEEIERHHVERVLGHHGGNRTHAAKELGISRATLIQKIKRYGLQV